MRARAALAAIFGACLIGIPAHSHRWMSEHKFACGDKCVNSIECQTVLSTQLNNKAGLVMPGCVGGKRVVNKPNDVEKQNGVQFCGFERIFYLFSVYTEVLDPYIVAVPWKLLIWKNGHTHAKPTISYERRQLLLYIIWLLHGRDSHGDHLSHQLYFDSGSVPNIRDPKADWNIHQVVVESQPTPSYTNGGYINAIDLYPRPLRLNQGLGGDIRRPLSRRCRSLAGESYAAGCFIGLYQEANLYPRYDSQKASEDRQGEGIQGNRIVIRSFPKGFGILLIIGALLGSGSGILLFVLLYCMLRSECRPGKNTAAYKRENGRIDNP